MSIQMVKWAGQRIDGPLALDTETTNIVMGQVPELVLWTANYGTEITYYGTHETIDEFLAMHTDNTIIMHHAPFDLAVLRTSELYDNIDRFHDTLIFWRLLWLAKDGQVPMLKHCGLAHIVNYFFQVVLNKEDDLRLGWRRGDDFSTDKLEYAGLDAYWTFKCWEKMYPIIKQQPNMLSYPIQIRGCVALADIERRGIAVDKKEINRLVEKFDKEMDERLEILTEHGYYPGTKFDKKVSKGNKKVLTEYIRQYIKENNIKGWPLTDKKQEPKAGREVIEKYGADDRFLNAYAEFCALNKQQAFIRDIEDDVIYPRYDWLKVTGRTSCSKPNLQQQPRVGGIRECFVPRKGHRMIIMDYSFIELCSLAQVCYTKFGLSRLRDVINTESEDKNDYDPHTRFAKDSLGKKEVSKEERQGAKAANFGLPGGMGKDTFIDSAKKQYGVTFTNEQFWEIKNRWLTNFPEMKRYLDSHGEQKFNVRTLTGRLRANADYCAAKNTEFQGLTSDGVKLALWKCFRAGLKVIAFIHDEIVIESDNIDIDWQTLEDCMIHGMQKVVPDVKIRVEGKICERWEK